ncbi:ORF105 [Agrotis segetum granulovirus]|uniref:ORF105 n=1 Tax=Agrotis segetum granulosis virus TaxID=10464 RepID=Q6QXG5_GVAS|nr:hypothetical protein AsGV119 [Agrotis segetum granulovirus]AAS82633.1 ORF105 [Agrotis segetum granulovirus]AHN92155.1 hypothetical protein AsGV116 [Agrotis segetum granulovirus]AKN63393.1 hypothetical protein AsGV119 [Agrotis segetum granulovirus]
MNGCITFEKLRQRKKHHEEIINVVQEMMRAERVKRVDPKILLQRVQMEYYNCNGKTKGHTLDCIINTYNLLKNYYECLSVLKTSFYDNNYTCNYGIRAFLEKINVCEQTERVRLKFYSIDESQICEECFEQYTSSGSEQHDLIMSECNVEPQHSYWFSCTYICDYCFKNKLYSKLPY